MEPILFDPDPTSYLPHRPPFLFIDRVLDLQPGASASGEFAVAAQGHFPPLLLVEAMAQLGGIAAGQRGGEGGVLAALREVNLPASVPSGAKLSVHARVVKAFGRLIQVEGEVHNNGVIIASAVITLGIGSS